MFPQGRWFRARSWVIALASAAFLALIWAPLASTASARPSSIPNPSPIKHVVVLYLENQSFDSILGYWCKAHTGRCMLPGRGFAGMPSSVKLSNGAVVKPRVSPDIVPNVDHSVRSQQLAMDGGKMDGWWKIKGCMPRNHYACIGGYQPGHIPNATNLASEFAISDDMFSMADSPSWGGHMYAVAANLDHFTGDNPTALTTIKARQGWGCNSNRVAPWVSPLGITKMIPSCVPDYSLGLPHGGAFEKTPAANIPTIMDRMDAKGLSWKIYGQNTQPTGKNAKGYIWDICPTFAQCLDTKQSGNNKPTQQFLNDAGSGHLPALSVVTPGGAFAADSEHNGFSMTAGDNFIGQVMSKLMAGGEFKSTALFITWDDCGCFYDQVPPVVKNPDGTHRGPRSPLIIVSPFARHGFTDTTRTTFASILAFAEHNFKLAPLGPNDQHAYWFQNAFNFAQTPLAPVPMVTRPVPRGEHIDMAEANQDT